MSLVSLLKTGKDAFLDVLFPLYCVGCGVEGVWACSHCLQTIPHLTYPPAQKVVNVDDLFIVTSYDTPLVQELICVMKFQEMEDVVPLLAGLMTHYLQKNQLYQSEMIFTFVPMHFIRKRWRGFNQAQRLSQEIAKSVGGMCVDTLVKKNYTRPQSGLVARYRKRNVSGSYQLKKGVEVRGKTWILVDDVLTTGATMEACARLLKQAGAAKVIGCAIAQGG